MSSKIQEALAKAVEVDPSKRRNETISTQSYLQRLVAAVEQAPDEVWNGLPRDAQDWYNLAADAAAAKSDLPMFPDDTDAAKPAEASSGRRRTSSEAAAPAATSEPYSPKIGDKVKAVTKRGKEITGDITELDDSGIVIMDGEGKDHELSLDVVLTLVEGGKTVEEEAEDTDPPKVGDTVRAVTKRGKEIAAAVVEVDEDGMLVKDAAGEEHDLSFDKLESYKVVLRAEKVKAAAGDKKPPAASGNKPAAASKRATPSANGGVPVTTRMREIIAADPSITKDAVTAALKKENLEFKPTTLDLVYGDSMKLIALLREYKKLK